MPGTRCASIGSSWMLRRSSRRPSRPGGLAWTSPTRDLSTTCDGTRNRASRRRAPRSRSAYRRAARAPLDFATPVSLNTLRWYADPRQPPQSGEIEIRVRATGLNFRDLMYAMGMLSDEAVEHGFAGDALGMEGAGA